MAGTLFLLYAGVETAPLDQLQALLGESTDALVLGVAVSLVACAGRDAFQILDLLRARRHALPERLSIAVSSVRDRFAR